MSSRFVLLYPDNQFNRGTVTSGHLLIARVAERSRGAMGGMAAAGVHVRAHANITVPRAAGISDDDVRSAEANGPPLSSLKVVKRLTGDEAPILIECDGEDRLAIQREYPGARLVPEGAARMALMALELQQFAEMAGVGSKPPSKLRVKVRDSSGIPIPHVKVQAIFDRKARPLPLGSEDTTDAKGAVTLLVPARFKSVELRAEPGHSFWPAAKAKVTLDAGTTSVKITCPSIVAANDCARKLYSTADDSDGAGVVVAVVDGGAGPHTKLSIQGGKNLVDDEAPGDISDNGVGHGTHVAGLIAGKSTKQFSGGVAPSATLRVYRVFRKLEKSCGSFDVADAIEEATDDGADLINLSLTLPKDQPEIVRAIRRARSKGVAVIAAAGNEGGPVMFPARFSGVLAVSAMGIMGCAPEGSSIDLAFMVKPLGKDPTHRIADFTCRGEEIDLIGPGAGIVSLFPKGKRSVMSGTSMATPVVVGRIARALALNSSLLKSTRDQKRSDEINKLALKAAKNLGFSATFQGQGLPD